MHHLLTEQKLKLCDACAYSESGRVVAAYLCGYNCMEMQLMPVPDDDGFFSYALIDYGNDTTTALQFIGDTAGAAYFRSLSLTDRLYSIEVGQRLSRIFVAGSVAAAVHRNGGDVHIAFPVQMDYTDLVKVEHLHKVISEMMVNTEVDFLENEVAQALYSFENTYVWKSIEALAIALLQHQYLGKNDIEECLEKAGLLPLYS